MNNIIEYYYFICDIMTHIYFIIIDIFYYGSFEIFNGNGKTINQYILNCFKNFYTKRYAYYYKDLWNKTVLSNVSKYMLVEDGNKKVRKCLNFGSYDYLGLNIHNIVYDYHEINVNSSEYYNEKLKNEIKKFTNFKYIELFGSGFSTNSLNLSKIISNNVVISDEFNHYSIVEGIRWNYSTNNNTTNDKHIFKHNDINDLENILKKIINDPREKFVIIEGIYSMHGHLFNIPELLRLKNIYKFKIIVDEAHSFGCIGDNSKGSFDYYNYELIEADIFISTFSKTFNSNGGFIATNDLDLYKLISNNDIGYDKISKLTCHHIINIFDYINSEDGKKNFLKLKHISNYAYDELYKQNFKLISSKGSPVICIDIGYAHQACKLFRYTFDNNLALVIIGYPAADLLKLTLRLCMTSYHTEDDIKYLISVLKKKPIKYLQEEINNKKIEKYTFNDFKNINEVIKKYGIGSSGPHAFYGTLQICNDVEQIISKYFNKEDTLITQHNVCGYKSIVDYIKSVNTKCIFIEYNEYINLDNLSIDNENICLDLSYFIALKYLKLNTNYNLKEISKNKYIIIDLNKTFCYIKKLSNNNFIDNNLDIKGTIFISDKNTIFLGRKNIKSYVFSATFPAFNYYLIGDFFIKLQ